MSVRYSGSAADSDDGSESANDLIDSPLFNCHNSEASSAQQPHHHFVQAGNTDSGSLPPPTDEPQYEVRQTRCGVYSVADIESLDEAEFPDAGQDLVKTPDDANHIIQEIKAVVLFEGYDDDQLLLVANYMYKQTVRSGDVIIEHGSHGDALYVVKNGTFKCTLPDAASPGGGMHIRSYHGSGHFGELALINQAPRAATITASTDGELWVLSALRYSWLRKRRAMLNAERFEKVIRAIPLFRDHLNPSLINRLIDAIEVVNLAPGDVICREGEPGDAMYFIMAGEVEATISGVPVTNIVKNGFFGERALVLDEGRAATCCAIEDTKLAKLPKESFELLIPDNVIDKMKHHIAVTYVKASNDDDVTDDELSTTSVYMEYLCQDLNMEAKH